VLVFGVCLCALLTSARSVPSEVGDLCFEADAYGSVGDLSLMDGSGRLVDAGSTCTVSCMW